jgi:hypothetical protein
MSPAQRPSSSLRRAVSTTQRPADWPRQRDLPTERPNRLAPARRVAHSTAKPAHAAALCCRSVGNQLAHCVVPTTERPTDWLRQLCCPLRGQLTSSASVSCPSNGHTSPPRQASYLRNDQPTQPAAPSCPLDGQPTRSLRLCRPPNGQLTSSVSPIQRPNRLARQVCRPLNGQDRPAAACRPLNGQPARPARMTWPLDCQTSWLCWMCRPLNGRTSWRHHMCRPLNGRIRLVPLGCVARSAGSRLAHQRVSAAQWPTRPWAGVTFRRPVGRLRRSRFGRRCGRRRLFGRR